MSKDDQKPHERLPVRLTGENLPYLYEIDYQDNIKYPKFSFYIAEAFFHLFRNRYLSNGESAEQICFAYGGSTWEPFSIMFTPGLPDEDGYISEDNFDVDMHDALVRFFDDLVNIDDGLRVSIFENENHFFLIQAKKPQALYELLKNYLDAFNVPSKKHSSLSFQGPLNEGFAESEVNSRLRTQYERTAKSGLEIYNDELTSNTSMGNFSLRLCEGRAYSSLKSVGVSIAISSEMPLQISMGELKAILQAESGEKTKPFPGYDLTN